MATPSFPTLNGQIKTGFRWYNREIDLNEYRLECREDDAPDCHWFAYNTPNDRLPPFEIAYTGLGVVTEWKVYDLGGNEVADLSDDIDLLESVPFEGLGYVIYEGVQIGVVLPAGVYKMQMVVDGELVYSERIKVICGGLGADQMVNGDFSDGLAGWTFSGNHIFNAVRTTNTPGNPDTTGLQIGDLVVNFGDDLIYTYAGGASFTTASPGGVEYYYILETDQWYRWNGSWSGLANDPVETIPNAPNGFLACWNPPPAVTLTYDLMALGLAPGAYQLVIEFNVAAVNGTLNFTGPGGADVTSAGGTDFEFDIIIPAGTIDPIVLTPSIDWDGCVRAITLRPYATVEDCFATLMWSHCGNIGSVYYEQGFKNILYIDKRDTELTAAPNILIQGEENAQKRFKPTLRVRETNYAMVLGYLPWYVRDALAELPLCDLVELRMPGQTQFDELIRPMVVFEDDEVGDGACTARTTLAFQLDEASVTSACCVTFDPPCITPCTDQLIIGTTEEDNGEGWYILPNSAQIAFNDGDTLGAPVDCASRLVQTDEVFTEDPFLLFTGGEWQPLITILDVILPTSCDGDAPFNISANIPARYNGQPQVSLDGGVTWTNVGNSFTADEWGSGVDVFLPEAGDFRILAIVNDCEIGWSAPQPFDCCTAASLTECFFYQDFRIGGTDGQLMYEVASFFVDGIEQLAEGVPFTGPLNVITVDGRPFVTNLIDALNKCDVCGFSFWPAENRRPIGDDDIERGGYFRVRRPTAVGFEIIIKTRPFGNFAYRYTDGDGAEIWDGLAWIQTWQYEDQNPGWTAGPPEDCEVIS